MFFFAGNESPPPPPVKHSMIPDHLPPNSYFGSPLGLLHFQHQLQQQAISSSLLQRAPGAMSLPYHSHLSQAASLLGGSSAALPPASPWSPYFLFPRQPQSGSNMAASENSPPNGLPHLHNRGIPSAGMPPTSVSLSNNNPHKELILNNSIESLRMRARQHSASLGLYD